MPKLMTIQWTNQEAGGATDILPMLLFSRERANEQISHRLRWPGAGVVSVRCRLSVSGDSAELIYDAAEAKRSDIWPGTARLVFKNGDRDRVDHVLWADPNKPYERLEPVIQYLDDGTEGEIERQTRFGRMSKRPEQTVFSASVRDAYNETCAVTGCATPEALEAAHIKVDERDRGGEEPRVDDNSIENGILLRADIHALFDAGLISLSKDGKTVDVSERLSDETYSFLKGKKVSPPMYSPPSRDNILSHRRRFGFE